MDEVVESPQGVEQNVPPFHAFILPVLEVLSDGKEHGARDVVEGASTAMQLDQAQLAESIASGYNRVTNRVQWALTYLFQAGAVERPKRGHYRINDRGRELLASHPKGISVQDLRQFPEFVDFQTRSRGSGESSAAVAQSDESTPRDDIESAAKQLDTATAAELVERIKQQSPAFLEKAVVRLLVAMGYGGSHGDGQHLGGPGDQGFDGVINQDPLGLGRIYIQAKRYSEGSVGRPDIQGFLGALHAANAVGGVFITTSRFSADAAQFAATVNPRIVLIDGPRLGELLVRYGIGVQEQHTYKVVEVDEDFFE